MQTAFQLRTVRRKHEYQLRITRRFGVSDVSEATCLDRRVVVAKARIERELELAAQRTAEANGLLTDSLRAICRVERRRECCSGLAARMDCVVEANGFAQHHDIHQPRSVEVWDGGLFRWARDGSRTWRRICCLDFLLSLSSKLTNPISS